jgi:hypothetical protein
VSLRKLGVVDRGGHGREAGEGLFLAADCPSLVGRKVTIRQHSEGGAEVVDCLGVSDRTCLASHGVS